MNHQLKENERELIKLINFFKKKAEKLMSEGKLSEKHAQVVTACEGLVERLYANAENRNAIIKQREELSKIVKDNASCPKCEKNTHLKHIGIDTHEQGWKSNKYLCRRCNITFVWNRPNNPWDMIPYLEMLITDLKSKVESEESGMTKEEADNMISNMEQNIDALRPVLEISDRDYKEMKDQETEMDKMIHGFKQHLQIQRIKMDTWEN